MNVDSEFQASLDALRALPGLNVTSETSQQGGVLVKLASRMGTCTYITDARRGVTTSTLPAVIEKLERTKKREQRQPLLLSLYLTPAVRERLRAERIEFVDGAGNIFLDSPAAYVLISGHKPEREPHTANLTATDLKLLYALLSRPALRSATYRDLSEKTGVSLGKVSDTLAKLKAAKYLYEGKSGALFLTDAEKLLERWEVGYLEQLRPKLIPSSWRLGKPLAWESVLADAMTRPGVLVGGEVAADELTYYLKPAALTLHVPKGQSRAVAIQLRLLPAKDEPEITLLARFVPPAQVEDPCALDRFQNESRWNLTDPILVRAELLAHGDSRLREVAGRILDDTILPKLPGTDA